MQLDPGWVTIATGAMTLVGIGLGVVNTYFLTRATRKISDVAKHTNGMHEKLLEVTGSAEFRKGFAIGAGSTDPSMAAFAQLQQRDNEAREKLAGESIDRRAADEAAQRGDT